MRLSTTTLFISAAAFALHAAAGASTLKKWRTPTGGVFIGETAPPGSIELKEYTDEPRPDETVTEQPNTTSDRQSVAISLRRHKIDEQINEAATRLEEIRSEIERLKKLPGLLGRSDAVLTDARGRRRLLNPHEMKQKHLRELKEIEQQQLAEIGRLRQDFAALKQEVRSQYGGTAPDWWRDSLSCPKCPKH